MKMRGKAKLGFMSGLYFNVQITPAPYVKVYLVKGKRCVAKAKTGIARRTLDPLYQQQLTFREKYQGCILQVMLRKYFVIS